MLKILLFSLISSATVLAAGKHPQSFRRPLVFEPNRGQAPAQVTWMARGAGYQLFLTSEGVTMVAEGGPAGPSKGDVVPISYQAEKSLPSSAKPRYSTVHMKLNGSRPWKDVTGLEPTGGISNYFLGNDPKAWRTNIPHYARVVAAGVYDGIDLAFYNNGGNLEYDFVVAPGADPKQIRLAFDGMDQMRVDDRSGDLVLTTAGVVEVRHVRPKVYQQTGNRRVEVAGGYKLLEHGGAAFLLASYDRRRPLVIDPSVTLGVILGGTSYDAADAMAVDSAGNAYVAGATLSPDFPTNASSLQWDQPLEDGFVTKISPQGEILFSTYLGGNDHDSAYGIAVDSTGVYVTGPTASPDFPHQIYKRTHGTVDIFVTKLYLDGNGIYYTAILGTTSFDDWSYAMAVNPATHEAYVTGLRGALTPPYPTDAAVYKVDASGNLAGSQVMAGSGSESGYGIALDHSGDVWITGSTCSPDFPIVFPTPQQYPVTRQYHCPGFVAKWDSQLITLKMSRFWGWGGGIAVDAANNVYVTGSADTPAVTAVAGAFQFNAPNLDAAFVTKFDTSGAVLKSTYLGGATGASGGDMVSLNAAGEVYVSGSTSSTDFPGAPFSSLADNGFLTKLSSDLSTLQFTRLLGRRVHTVAVFESAPPFSITQVWAAGYRYTGPAQTSAADAFVVRLDDDVDHWQLLLQDPTTREMSALMLNGKNAVSGTEAIALPCATSDACSPIWKFFGAVDIDLNGFGDLVQYNATTGELRAWLRGTTGTGAVFGPLTLSKWCGTSDGCSQTLKPVGVGDFNHDGAVDLLWHNDKTGFLEAWLLDGAGGVISTLQVGNRCAIADGCWTRYRIIGIGDFNHDGIDDLFWYDTTNGRVNIAMLNGSGGVITTQWLAQVCGHAGGCSAKWKPAGLADVNHDGVADLLWEDPATGDLQAWLLKGVDRLLGIVPISQPCAKCTQTSQPVGILRDYHFVN